ncbi:MAG: DNA repair protein RadC [Candidatus Ventricola sp.]
MAEKEKSIHAGHRERLRERLRTAGLGAFSEHEVLELLLTYAIPKRDVNPLAHELIAVFGSLSAVLGADENELLRVKGVGKNAALLLTMMPQLMRYYQMNALGERPVIVTMADARAYCAPLFLGVTEEQIYMVCLDQAGHVLHRSLLHTGTVDQVALHPRTVVETAIRHNAYSVILAHNHPSGVAAPSQQDLDVTKRITSALYLIGIRLVDHLIFAGGEAYSMVRGGCLDGAPEGEAFSYVANIAEKCAGGLKDEEYAWVSLAPDGI